MIWLLTLLACGDPSDTGKELTADTGDTGETGDLFTDADGDGFAPLAEGGDDCDDADDRVHPGAAERCNDGVDDDCDPATGEEGQVTVDGGLTFDVLQHALAVAHDGAEVLVCGGTFHEALTIGLGVTVRATSPATLDASAEDASAIVVDAPGADVRIGGIAVIGGPGTLEDDGQRYGGGLYVREAGTLTLEGVTITGGMAGYGGGAAVRSGALVVEGGALVENEAEWQGGGLWAGQGVEVRLDGTTFTTNRAPTGAGAMLGDGGSATIEGSLFEGNEANALGGGIHADGADLDVTDSTFSANWGWECPAVVSYRAEAILTDVFVTSNLGSNTGALCAWTDAIVTMHGGGVTMNRGDGLPGGASVSGTLVSDGTDWGELETDNMDGDVWMEGGWNARFSFGAGASFTCEGTTGTCL